MKKIVLVTFISLYPFLSSLAQSHSEVRRLIKCYSLFTSERISPDHPLLAQVKSGAISGKVACDNVLSHASLSSNNQISKVGQDFDYEGMRILNTFNNLHRSFFEVSEFSLGDIENPTRDLFDNNIPSYHWTYTLFKNGENLSNLVTRNFDIRAIRYSSKANRTKTLSNQNINLKIGQIKSIPNTSPTQFDKSDLEDWNPLLAQTGILVGLKKDTDVITLPRYYGSNKFNNFSNHFLNGHKLNSHYGAGFLGSQTYLLGNMGKFSNADGGNTQFRRWGKHVLSELLCRELPALRTVDVIDEVYGESNISFRQGISCMQCHESMDPLAGVIRNMGSTVTTNDNAGKSRVRYLFKRDVDMARADLPTIARDGNFYRRPAEGRLHYRSYNGDAIKIDIEGLEALGEELAKRDDFYVCTARKYYEFLTGIHADLSDQGDFNAPNLSAGELYHRNKVIELGLKLKQHQSLKSLISEIVSSPIFLSPDKRGER